MKKVIHSIIGILIIFFGCAIANITIYNEELITLFFKIGGFLTFLAGLLYLKKIVKLDN